MKCPKCNNDKHVSEYVPYAVMFCLDCNISFTEWQQDRIAELEAALEDAEDVIDECRLFAQIDFDHEASASAEALLDVIHKYLAERKAQREGEKCVMS